MDYDVIVVGAGSMGMAAGYFLAKNGTKTLLLDANNPPHDKGSHHGETRIIRYAYGEGESYVPFAQQAGRLWKELEEETGQQLFWQTGVLNLGKEKDEFIQNVLGGSEKFSLPLQVMNAEEMNIKWPGLSVPKEYIGCFEPASGVLKAEKCIEAYRMAAERHGAQILTNTKVESISANGETVSVKTADKTFTAGSTIVAAGAWAGGLLSELGLRIPLQPVRKTFAWFDSDEELYNQDNFPAFTISSSRGTYYGFPSIEGAGVKVGRHDQGEEIDPDGKMAGFGEAKGDKEDLEQVIRTYMAREQKIKYGKTCIYTLTPDEDFVIDRHPDFPNIAIAAGFSGHGFKFSSAVGQVLSDLILKGESDTDISPFSIERFSGQ